MNPSTTSRFLEKHAKLVILLVLVLGLILVLALAEIGFRLFGRLNIHYYSGHRTQGMHQYPYGMIPINGGRHPDEEFDMKAGERRIGYFGDSVTYGVGAGYGYRIPDLLQASFPAYRHWVFAQVGEALTFEDVNKEAKTYQLASAIYLMNLNDVLPGSASREVTGDGPPRSSLLSWARTSFLGPIDGALRGKSYLYTYVRLGVKNGMQRAGYEAHGQVAYELQPRKYQDIVEATAERVVSMVRSAANNGLGMCVVLLPYEMQVSADAAAKYASLGFSWEDGFLDGSTQKILMDKMIRGGVSVFDARHAFSGEQFKVGDTFVYDKGDKIDWNHPNRAGHARMAAWLTANPEFKVRCLPH